MELVTALDAIPTILSVLVTDIGSWCYQRFLLQWQWIYIFWKHGQKNNSCILLAWRALLRATNIHNLLKGSTWWPSKLLGGMLWVSTKPYNADKKEWHDLPQIFDARKIQKRRNHWDPIKKSRNDRTCQSSSRTAKSKHWFDMPLMLKKRFEMHPRESRYLPRSEESIGCWTWTLKMFQSIAWLVRSKLLAFSLGSKSVELDRQANLKLYAVCLC